MEKLLIIPMPLGQKEEHREISDEIRAAIRECDLFFAERARTFRRFIGPIDRGIEIQKLNIEELPKKPGRGEIRSVLELASRFKVVGLVSEAGCPGIADPGHYLVRFAHRENANVVPLSGPSSIFLALMASGLNGQQFCFHGYLPRQDNACTGKILELERNLRKTGYTQIFMETPYRNNQLMERLLNNLNAETMLHVSCDLTTADAFSRTQTVQEWKRSAGLNLHKKPSIFAIGQ